MTRLLLLAAASAALAFNTASNHPTGPRITPPTVDVITPRGIARGTTAELTIEGLNLAHASRIYFSRPGLTGRIVRVKELPDLPDIRLGSNGTPSTIDLGPLPPRNQVTVEVDVDAEADIGEVSFRLHTPLGTSPEGTLLVEPYYGESPDREPNDLPEDALETFLPSVLVGAISRPGDVDHFKIQAKAGQELVFENPSARIGSTLQPVVTILAEDQTVTGEYGLRGGDTTLPIAHRFAKDGVYYIRISDYQQGGRASHTYRIKVGEFPVAVSAFPLGVRKGTETEVTFRGFHLGPGKVTVKGQPSAELEDALLVRPEFAAGKSFREVRLAVGSDPEVMARGGSAPQPITLPVTINGRLTDAAGHSFSFPARKGQKLVFEVNARRLGSELDSYLEILDAKGNPVEQATIRAVWETFTVLRDHDSTSAGIRIQNWNSLAVGDWVMIGSEVLRVEALPRTPDDDLRVESFGGQRIAYFNTSSEAHAVDKAVYKVHVHPAGAQFSPNGLPLVRSYYRNDDGGPGLGKDSLIRFVAPADGVYTVRLTDVRGMSGESMTYRLMVREPQPDFRLAVNPRNPNVPRSGFVPVGVTAFRRDGFDGPIEVTLQDLPPGLRATRCSIPAGQVSCTVLLSAGASAQLDRATPLIAIGSARIGGQTVVRRANPDDAMALIAVMPKPDLLMTALTREVVLEPGGTADVTVRIERQHGFGGRVPVVVRDLPPRVRVLDVGLNGVLINEDESTRTFTLEALPSAEPGEQWIYVGGNVETRSPLQTIYAAGDPILVKVKANAAAAKAAAVAPSERSTAPQ